MAKITYSNDEILGILESHAAFSYGLDVTDSELVRNEFGEIEFTAEIAEFVETTDGDGEPMPDEEVRKHITAIRVREAA